MELSQKNYEVYSIEQAENSISLLDFEIEPNKKYAFVFGHEVKGVQQEVVNNCKGCIEIPQLGTKHSFNVSVSLGIVLWDTYIKYIQN